MFILSFLFDQSIFDESPYHSFNWFIQSNSIQTMNQDSKTKFTNFDSKFHIEFTLKILISWLAKYIIQSRHYKTIGSTWSSKSTFNMYCKYQNHSKDCLIYHVYFKSELFWKFGCFHNEVPFLKEVFFVAFFIKNLDFFFYSRVKFFVSPRLLV